jgi:hypothetical protein
MAVLRPAPLGYEQITSVSAAVGLTVPSGADRALVQAFTQAVRWRDDGTDPTGSVGMVLAAGATLVYDGDLSALSLIEAASSAELNVTYYQGG